MSNVRNVISMVGDKAPTKSRSSMETLILSIEEVNQWKIPPFQRPLRVNCKVQEVAEHIKSSESIDGVVTLGTIRRGNTFYIVDGQHRIEAFRLSELKEVLADVRIVDFADFAEMAEEFGKLNASLVKMRPDDTLRAMEMSHDGLARIRKSCPFVGYDHIRRGTSGPIVSMSALIRSWHAAGNETPAMGGTSVSDMVKRLDDTSIGNLVAFLSVAHSAWGRDPEYYRLWSNLNMTICMWLWIRLVVDKDRRSPMSRYVTLDIPKFKKCLMSVSATEDYLNWLLGRNLSDRDRSPCFNRLKAIFVRRLAEETGGKRPLFPSPAWASK